MLPLIYYGKVFVWCISSNATPTSPLAPYMESYFSLYTFYEKFFRSMRRRFVCAQRLCAGIFRYALHTNQLP